jgi:glycosyltransferase involved in cell wall biosynthesis
LLSLSEKLLLTDACANRRMRVLWIEHDRVGRWLERNPWLGMLKRTARWATIVTVSHLSKRIYEWLGFDPDGIIAIPNGIETARLRLQEKPKPNPHLRLGCIARLSPEKGVDVLLRALALVPEVSLELIGQGPQEASLRALAGSLGIAGRVTFITQHVDVREVYARIDALALPSNDHDPFGLAAGEAMMLGLPVIVTNACGIADYLGDNEDALVVPAGSAEALAAAITALQDAGTRERLGAAAQDTAEREFSVDAMIEAYEEALS